MDKRGEREAKHVGNKWREKGAVSERREERQGRLKLQKPLRELLKQLQITLHGL